MRVGADDVRHVAALARLHVVDAERLADELTRVLAWVDLLEEASGASPLEGEVRRRPDEARLGPAAAVLAESAGRDGPRVRVPTG